MQGRGNRRGNGKDQKFDKWTTEKNSGVLASMRLTSHLLPPPPRGNIGKCQLGKNRPLGKRNCGKSEGKKENGTFKLIRQNEC
jgi:hypothetical protein